MKSVLAITVVFLGLVFFNCGDSLVNSGNNSPQVETGRKVGRAIQTSSDSAVHGYGAFGASTSKMQVAGAEN